MPRRMAQQRMTLSDLECLKSTSPASRAIPVIAELLVSSCVSLSRELDRRELTVHKTFSCFCFLCSTFVPYCYQRSGE